MTHPSYGVYRVKKHREDRKQLMSDYERTEEDLKAIQSVGMLIGDVLKRMDDERFITNIELLQIHVSSTIHSHQYAVISPIYTGSSNGTAH